jgi:signal transduction histidine kinase/ActR/RegA family two-component response regulator
MNVRRLLTRAAPWAVLVLALVACMVPWPLQGTNGLIGAGTLVISLLLCGLIATITSTRSRATLIAAGMTADLRASEARSSKWTEVLLRLTAQQACLEGDLRTALRHITQAGAEALDVSRVSVWTLQDGDARLVCLDQYERPGVRHRPDDALSPKAREAFLRAIDGGQLIAVDGSLGTSIGRAVDEASQITAALIVPVRLSGQAVGVLAHEQDGVARRWTLLERNFAASLAAQVSLTLETRERRRTEQVLKDYAGALEAANASLEESAHAVQAANHAKTEFLANMSHEIRTPLTSILGYAELVLHDEQIAASESERQSALRVIQRNGEHLLGILNDILDLSKIEAGKLVCEQIRFSPGRLLLEVSELMGVRAQAKGLEFETTCEGSIPQTIYNDPTRLRQILINLLGNAVKFTEHGRIHVVVRLPAHRSELLEFEVRDTGIGMDAAQQEIVFEPFAQADTSTTRQFGGTGLGLAISSRLATLLGGRLECESQAGSGSVFRVLISTGPLEGVPRTAHLDDAQAAGPLEVPAEQAPLAGRRVLLAEDGADNQRLVSLVLHKAGAEVKIVENGREAVDAALAAWRSGNSFDIVLMDMQMPVLDGYGATAQLRDAEYPGLIVALTAHAMVGDREKCLAAGCSDYATKPINRRALVARLAELLAQRPARQKVRR